MNLKGKGNVIQSFWLGMGYFASFAVGIGSAMILSRYFDKAEYGTYRQIIYVYSTLLVIFSAGLPKVYSYFLPKYSIEEGKYIANKITKLLLFLGVLFSITLYISSDLIAVILKNPELSIGLKVFSPIPFLMLPTLGIEGIYSTYKNTLVIAIYNTVTRLLMLFFIVFPVIYFEGSYIHALYGWIIVSVISFIVAIVLKNRPFKEYKQRVPDIDYKMIFSYSLPILVASLAGIAIKSSNQFFISRYFGEEEFAIFSNGFIQLPFVVMVTTAVGTVLMPQISKLHEVNKNKIAELYKSAILNSSILLYPILSFFIVFSEDIVVILFSDIYSDSSTYFKISMTLNYFNIIVFAPILLGLGASRFYSKIHIYTAIIIWILNFVIIYLLPNPHLIVITFVLFNIILVLASFRKIFSLLEVKLKNMIPLNSFIKIIAHTLISAFIVYYLVGFLNVTGILKVLISLSFYSLLLLTTDILVKNNFLKNYTKIKKKIIK